MITPGTDTSVGFSRKTISLPITAQVDDVRVIFLSLGEKEIQFVNGRLFPSQIPSENVPILHYMQLDKFLLFLRRGKVRMARIDQFRNDPDDGCFPLANLVSESAATKQLYESLVTIRNKAKMVDSNEVERLFRYAHCWFEGAKEKQEMWNTFGDNSQGVCIRSETLALEQAIASVPDYLHVEIRRCPYFGKSEAIPELFTAAAVGAKKEKFRDQREIRLSCCVKPDAQLIDGDGNYRDTPSFIELDVDPAKWIKQIITGPQMPLEHIERLMRDSAQLCDPGIIHPSELTGSPGQ